MSPQQHIINHLFEFFEFISKKSSATHHTEKGFKEISHTNSSWPNFIYNIDLRQITTSDLAKKIFSKQLPHHLILTAEQVNEHENELTTNGFIPIAEWSCLELDKENLKPRVNQQFNIKKITTKEDLKDWTKVASTGFGTLENSIFENCFNNKAVEFYGGHTNSKLVATALLFHHNNTTGIYHVVTLPEERGKGFGSELFTFCEHKALKNGADRVIAQSTTEGLNAWLKTGMKLYGNFYLFCLNKPKS
ncbi:MAG: GNAT family N-acetyltransferase [Vicingaceae bacterium]